MKKLVFKNQKEFRFIKKMCQNNVRFVIIGTLNMLDLNLNRMFVRNAVMY